MLTLPIGAEVPAQTPAPAPVLALALAPAPELLANALNPAARVSALEARASSTASAQSRGVLLRTAVTDMIGAIGTTARIMGMIAGATSMIISAPSLRAMGRL